MEFHATHVCLLLVVTLSGGVASAPDGVLNLFRTNVKELQHVPMKYDSSDAVPKWLEGTLVRNAPAMFELGGRSVVHVFDGFAKMHSIAIGQQGLNFSSAFLESSSYTRSKKAGRYAPSLTFLGVDPAFSEMEKVEALFYPFDNTDVNVWKFGHGEDSVYAGLTDEWVYAEFDLDTLASTGVSIPPINGVNFLSHFVQSCAHPIVEPGTNNSINYVLQPGMLPGEKQQYFVVRMKDLTSFEIMANFQTDKSTYMHSFGLTKNYVIFFAHPAIVSVEKMVTTVEVAESMQWFPDEKTNIVVANIKTGKVEYLQHDAIFVTHHANAYETDDGKLVVDLCASEMGISILTQYQIPELRNLSSLHKSVAASRFYRYTIDLANKSVETKAFRSMDPMEDFMHQIEVPIINENYRARQYCYVYGVPLDFNPSNPVNGSLSLVKKNICTPGKDQIWYHPNHYASEPSFVPNPDGTEEDDGVILSSVFDAMLEKNYLLILDAKTMKKINTAYMPTYIPFGFHGKFFSKH
ncbi:PREDICTED: carotenoid isomerooxygenase-like [Branchiostoma belcheri]|uniref:Carotenoid isomerooxygenase-like n=1 Tax=Branchiostoma belcheri TaxID=7741 RepID=A0A6P5A7Q1_BRABE|nr:PREDICTED: carotenoid isomerooxygenase-like [Branchiostoma belcheri]